MGPQQREYWEAEGGYFAQVGLGGVRVCVVRVFGVCVCRVRV
jgi:hypothetical protein